MCLIRRYSVTNGGDIRVVDFANGNENDISAEYQNVSHDPQRRRVEATLEVVQDESGQLGLRELPNGINEEARLSLQELLEQWLVDILVNTPAPRRISLAQQP